MKMGRLTLPDPTPSSGPRRRHGLKVPLSLISVLCLVLYVQFHILPQFIADSSPAALKVAQHHNDILEAGLQKCAEYQTPPIEYEFPVSAARQNPRWNPVSGQQEKVVLRNVTLFDGEEVLSEVDVFFTKGVVDAVLSVAKMSSYPENAKVFDFKGKYVTPGLVDMHSHHLTGNWPALEALEDTNEMSTKGFGPLTPFVRSLDGMKSYDKATTIIASGGVTSSLILPGSANIMGGEAYLVKNFLRSGKDGEEVVEELLLEHGIPTSDRRRYMKMACGENPRRVYDHTRMGNAWIFRHHMERAKELLEKQDSWCLSAAAARESGDEDAIISLTSSTSTNKGGLPEELELESSVGILRGQVGLNVHCYEPEDFEDMLLHSKEFGFRIQAFHHALSAWKVPELIKDSGENITIATFSEFGFYKQEGYEANLYAGKILADHGVPVAYKSDHGEEQTNAKYLLFQAATAHSFGLPADLALKSVTSVPAKSLGIDHRVGYVRPGYDADIVVWDSHPLSIGATPLQVYIDGRATLDAAKVEESFSAASKNAPRSLGLPQMRFMPSAEAKEAQCQKISQAGGKFVINGITKSFLEPDAVISKVGESLTMVVESGKVTCFGASEDCVQISSGGTVVDLQNGHALPGLTAVTPSLGLSEIAAEDSTRDGEVSDKVDISDPANVIYAKYGIHLEGRAFARARIGGITKAVTAPLSEGGLLSGVSVAFKTSENKTILNGGIVEDDVALHVAVGQAAKGESIPTVSSSIGKLRKLLSDNKGKDNVYGLAANGSLPLVVAVEDKYDIAQLIKLKKDDPSLNLVLLGASGAPFVAEELAAAEIPVILTHNRGAPDAWEKREMLVGPPLTKSAAAVLSEANVIYGLAIYLGEGESHIHNLPLEASWAAKYSGLSDKAAIDLVSRNIEKILGLKKSEDIVVYEGNPLEFGASVVFSLDGDDGVVMDCWPVSN